MLSRRPYHRTESPTSLVDDKQRGTFNGFRPVWFSVVCHLIAQPRPKLEAPTIGELRLEPASEAKENVPLRAPVIGTIARRIFNHAHANVPEMSCSGADEPRFSWMLDDSNVGPVSDAEWDFGYYHVDPVIWW